MAKTTDNDITKRAALKLLRRGLVTQSEAAHLAGASRQLMRYWVLQAEIPDARGAYLERLWRAATRR
jgi:hypothetical protein